MEGLRLVKEATLVVSVASVESIWKTQMRRVWVRMAYSLVDLNVDSRLRARLVILLVDLSLFEPSKPMLMILRV